MPQASTATPTTTPSTISDGDPTGTSGRTSSVQERYERAPSRDRGDHREAPVHRDGEQRDERRAPGGRRVDADQTRGHGEADRPAPAQPHPQTAQAAEDEVDGERARRDVLRAAVGQGQHHHANGQQETRGVDHPAADRAPGRAYRSWSASLITPAGSGLRSCGSAGAIMIKGYGRVGPHGIRPKSNPRCRPSARRHRPRLVAAHAAAPAICSTSPERTANKTSETAFRPLLRQRMTWRSTDHPTATKE
jgi:hypothetical protein